MAEHLNSAGQRRAPYATASTVGRDVLRRAAGVGLTTRQWKVLVAVLAFTALYSRLEDRVYLAQLAAFAFGVVEAEGWMLKRTREELKVLTRHGLVRCKPPRGRPGTGTGGPAYVIALVPGKDPDPGVSFSPEMDLAPGAEVTPILDRNGPRSWVESDPAPGGPTEKAPEKIPEHAYSEPIRTEARKRVAAKKHAGERINSEAGLLAYMETEVAKEFEGKQAREAESARKLGANFAAAGADAADVRQKVRHSWPDRPELAAEAVSAFVSARAATAGTR